jgi:hypothetical protein
LHLLVIFTAPPSKDAVMKNCGDLINQLNTTLKDYPQGLKIEGITPDAIESFMKLKPDLPVDLNKPLNNLKDCLKKIMS